MRRAFNLFSAVLGIPGFIFQFLCALILYSRRKPPPGYGLSPIPTLADIRYRESTFKKFVTEFVLEFDYAEAGALTGAILVYGFAAYWLIYGGHRLIKWITQ